MQDITDYLTDAQLNIWNKIERGKINYFELPRGFGKTTLANLLLLNELITNPDKRNIIVVNNPELLLELYKKIVEESSLDIPKTSFSVIKENNFLESYRGTSIDFLVADECRYESIVNESSLPSFGVGATIIIMRTR